ncbi:histidine ammonia-lyase [Pseudoalteromonas sp. SG43-7]|jgi:histidine ammonia-lyase|uniref:Histidine ammonia-lyase n=2 Tax=Pseudoalteromonas TaxID=53246 RepID=A0ABY3FEA9_9GAMM|nr:MULTISPECIES: histidine ammonia-lyase [Pseudoalteromonas]MBB1301833.1 histidine ammonia-lyase [Pseudoalteromonas sp. SR44-8]MBB1310436.1 histidine ammonia-lyase [Pseudoalteromonas sp. SR41-8]MBB1416209.1 histidine ammonia-lyase [Pseudoalteromonas sp. SG44-1]MBB1420360.1 histidine ammonia-lyase [Pseudoalteromonas sp. SG43-7]MBB1506740.1 histidine ammonia-lyase [Pseudoalteromonas sp. SG41-1]|tara:strand:+ start:4633 stop:6165 length:1533 start_codon:yes stop_codon:yes gene_type:complete
MFKLTLTPGKLDLATLRQINLSPVTLTLAKDSEIKIAASAQTVQDVIDQHRTVYGINTGFGLLANTKIAEHELELLQRSIVLSHAAGIGAYMDDSTVRLMMVLKINSLSRGFSGIRLKVIEFFMQLLAAQVYPCVPKKGSVGASGDLAPLSHMCLPLLGEGEMRYQGKLISAADGLKIAGLEPLTLAAKEGLALLNGTQASTAFALQGLFRAEDLYAQSCAIGSISIEAAMGSRSPFDARIHEIRGQLGQIDTAAMFRDMLGEHSQISEAHVDCEKVQDPYCLRCQPQVLGACLTQIRQAAEVLLCESNGVTDNPLVFADVGDIISGGNFHAEPVAMAADNLALAIAEIGALAERRIALLIDSNLSKLPPFLVENGGVNSGFMIAQVTAAALASENKSLAHPASVDSLPTSANQEDHVSMATFAARRLQEMADNTQGVLAIEWLASAQGLEFRKPLQASAKVEQAKATLRTKVSYYDKDRYFGPDIEAANLLLQQGELCNLLPKGVLPSF